MSAMPIRSSPAARAPGQQYAAARRAGALPLLLLLVMQAGGARAASAPVPALAISFEGAKSLGRWFDGTPAFGPGRSGKALTDCQLVMPPDRAALVYNRIGGTLTAWVKLLQRPRGGHHFRWCKLLTENRADLGIAGDEAGYARYDQPVVAGQFSATHAQRSLIEAGDWRFWAFTWGGGTKALYIDGRLITEIPNAPPFGKGMRLDLVTAENGARWALDDLQIFNERLTAEQVRQVMETAVRQSFVKGASPAADAPGAGTSTAAAFLQQGIAYDRDRQLVVNPTLGGKVAAGYHYPGGWEVKAGADGVAARDGQLHIGPTTAALTSVLIHLRRGAVVAGRPYRIGLRYSLHDGTNARLRIRNMMDMGSHSFALPATESLARRFFFAPAPEDYDVGLYYLEVQVEGPGATMTVASAYCRPATPDEARAAALKPIKPTRVRAAAVVPDERWIEALPAEQRFLEAADRRIAWGLAEPAGQRQRAPLELTLPVAGTPLFAARPPRELWQALAALRGEKPQAIPVLQVTRQRSPVEGGYGLDPLPARSVQGAALLFGIGALDTGLGTFQFQRLVALLESFGYFDPGTRFLPFWAQKTLYNRGGAAATARAAPQPSVPLAGEDDGENLGLEGELGLGVLEEKGTFYHTAPGVLTSAYLTRDRRLLLVLCNATDQALGKRGDVWIDHAALFGRAWSCPDPKSCTFVARDAETGIEAAVGWNRAAGRGGYVRDVWPEIVVAPGDYLLLQVEGR